MIPYLIRDPKILCDNKYPKIIQISVESFRKCNTQTWRTRETSIKVLL